MRNTKIMCMKCMIDFRKTKNERKKDEKKKDRFYAMHCFVCHDGCICFMLK